VNDDLDTDVSEPGGSALLHTVSLKLAELFCPLQNFHVLHGQAQEQAVGSSRESLHQVIKPCAIFLTD
jgi:hypothetical protein